MAENQYKRIDPKWLEAEVGFEYKLAPSRKQFWSTFDAVCAVCGHRKEIMIDGSEWKDGWLWFTDGTEDGCITCSDTCRAFLELQK